VSGVLKTALIPRLLKIRFLLLWLLVSGFMCLHMSNAQWPEDGDFWEHSAVARELTTHLIQPKHPQLLLDAPHAFYSPYAVAVSLLARALNLGAVTALAVMGLCNLSLLFLGIRFFVFSIVPGHRGGTAFYAVLLTFFWWGSAPWAWSGFFHVGVLGYNLPYPSTFSAGLTLIALGANQRRIRTGRPIWLALILPIAVTVLLSHPTTFIFLAAGLIAQACALQGSVLSQVALTVSVLGLAFLLAYFWPYFPALRLFADGVTGMRDPKIGFYGESKVLYQHVARRIWPSLIGLPLLFAGSRRSWRRLPVTMLIILSAIYALGAALGGYFCGRVLPYIVFLLQVVIAERIAAYEAKVGGTRFANSPRRLIVPAAVTAAALLLSLKPLARTLARSFPGRPPACQSYLFLSRFTGQYEVVLADIADSWLVPTFGGKVVASAHPLAFVPDQDARRSDLARFFDGETGPGKRREIIQKYRVNYLLLRKSAGAERRDRRQGFADFGEVVFENDVFVLISLKPGSE